MTPEERAENILKTLDLFFIDSEGGIEDRETAIRGIAAQIREVVEEGYEEANNDFNWLQSTVAKIYCHFTDNKMSKWNYDPDVVINEIEETQSQFWEKEIAKAKAEAYEDAAKIAEDYGASYRFVSMYEAVEFDYMVDQIRSRAKEIK